MPPPPPPPNVDHLRWSFSSPARRGRRNLRPWLLDGSGSASDGSPPSRWLQMGMVGAHHEGFYYEDEDHDSHHSGGEICFICGDLVGNHPEVPSVHLCDGGEYAYVGHPGRGGGGGGYGRRARRDHDPPCAYRAPGGYQEGAVYGAVGGGGYKEEKPRDDQAMDWLIERLQSSQLSMENMNQNMKDLCFKLKGNNQQYKVTINNFHVSPVFHNFVFSTILFSIYYVRK